MDIEQKTICRKLLATAHLDNVPWLDVSPVDWQESLDLYSDHKVLNNLVIDLVRDFALSHLKCNVSNDHQANVYRKRNHWEGHANLIVKLGVVDHHEEQDGQEVLEVIDAINHEVPDT